MNAAFLKTLPWTLALRRCCFFICDLDSCGRAWLERERTDSKLELEADRGSLVKSVLVLLMLVLFCPFSWSI